MRKLWLTVSALVLALGVAACGSGSGGGQAADPEAPLKVGVNPVPHAEILKYVEDNLAEKAGLKLEIVEFNDYVQPNVALKEEKLDANYFQHVPYLDEEIEQKGYEFTFVAPVHIEPLGLYSRSAKDLASIPAKAEVAIPNDVTNAGRALSLLERNGLLTLKPGAGTSATQRDITANPKNLKIHELEAAQLPRSLEDVGAAVVNGNYAIEAGLKPASDSLALEDGKDNPYANGLVVRKGDEKDPRVTKLVSLLQSPEVKKFIESKYAGGVLPAF
jgi:D-methionine transport system substrate-binding protein